MNRRHPPIDILVTCEHGGNRIPAEYRTLFRGHTRLLASHRGYDPGALDLGRTFARVLDAPLVASTVSRLLIELNRSPRHPALYSTVTRALARHEKARIVTRYYEPYRREVEEHVARAPKRGEVMLHVSAHSFTPVLKGEVRTADVGLLYDPARPLERALCEAWSALLQSRIAPLRVRRNYPYRGTADGLTTYLRRRYDADHYLGVEVEMNQRHVRKGTAHWRKLCNVVALTLREIVRP